MSSKLWPTLPTGYMWVQDDNLLAIRDMRAGRDVAVGFAKGKDYRSLAEYSWELLAALVRNIRYVPDPRLTAFLVNETLGQ